MARHQWFHVDRDLPESDPKGSIASREVDVFSNKNGIVKNLYYEEGLWIAANGEPCMKHAKFYKYTHEEKNDVL